MRIVSCFFLLVLLSSCAAQSQLVAGEELTVTEEKFAYYLYYPKGYEVDKEEGFGLLLFLHGGGEAGGDLEELKRVGPPKMLRGEKDFPFLILAPQNPHKKKWWNIEALNLLLEKIVAENNVDPNRIYLTGLSRGGSAAWNMAVQYPEKFAALAVVCGMAPAPYASWLDKKMPIWVFHGDEDKVIPVQESDVMVKKLKEMGYTVNYTRYKGVGHESWVPAYETDELYQWIASQKRM